MTTPAVFPVEGVIRRYAWGSPSAIPELLGTLPDGRPAAELWFGAHPGDPSPALGTTLEKLIEDRPVELLGRPVVDRFGPRLPFLLKVLAADKALSMQVHPTLAQARAGYAAEQAADLPADAPRNYADANHKPELLCALSPFEALCGFRPVGDTLALLDELAVPELGFLGGLLAGEDGLRAAFTALLEHDRPHELAEAVARRATPDGPLRPAYLAASDFPGDIGVVLSLLLNPVRLEPGEAIYLGAGNVHAYLRGTGVEIMANSDNVLRCGLTPKHIDVHELLEITDFRELPDPVRPAEQVGTAWWDYPVPVPDFALARIDLDGNGGALDLNDPRSTIVLCMSGRATVTCLGTSVELTPGHAAFVRAREQGFFVRGSGSVYTAAVGADVYE